MTHLLAIHCIGITHPDKPGLIVTGYDAQGEPIRRVQPYYVKPGEMFTETNPTDVANLLAQGAARELSDAELEVYERTLA